MPDSDPSVPSRNDEEGWLVQYYSKLRGELEFSRTRRDIVTNWGLTLFLAVVAAYAASLTTQAALPVFWRVGILAIGLGLSVRFFVQGMISYAFLRRWRYLEDKIESHWMQGQPSVQNIVREIQKYEKARRSPITKREMFWSQLRAGFVLIFSVLSILLIIELFGMGMLGWETKLIIVGLFVYLLWESYTFLTYDQLKKPT